MIADLESFEIVTKAPSTLSLKYFIPTLIIHGVASLQLPCNLLYAKASITS